MAKKKYGDIFDSMNLTPLEKERLSKLSPGARERLVGLATEKVPSSPKVQKLREYRTKVEKVKEEGKVMSPKKSKYYSKLERKGKVKQFFSKRDFRTGTFKEVIKGTPKDKTYTKEDIDKIEKSYEKRKVLGKSRRRTWKRGGKLKYERQIRAGTARLTSFLVPGTELPRSSYSQGYKIKKARVGRPRGPSGRYVIPGVGPVGVYQWRKWYRQQMSLERMERGRVPDYTEQEPDYNENPYPEYTGQPEQRRLPQRPITVERNDNILNAPNVARGELRNVGQRSALINVDDLNRPITNKGGDYYTEVDPVSGRQILHKRNREKWLS